MHWADIDTKDNGKKFCSQNIFITKAEVFWDYPFATIVELLL